MIKSTLIRQLDMVHYLATASKFTRLFNNPLKYAKAILHREVFYKKNHKSLTVKTTPFFNVEMQIILPASTDIYLTGGKSHDSEIKLARLMINILEEGDTFVDVGAHYGYFTLLGSKLVGQNGSVVSFEASPTTFETLHKNTSLLKNVKSINKAVSNIEEDLVFYDFPNLYSEYSTIDSTQFENEKWYQNSKPKKVTVNAISLAEYIQANNLVPKFIKIDVEGAEYKVINGLSPYLSNNSPIIVMEYLSQKRGDRAHIKAEKLLKSLNFNPYIIDINGKLKTVENVSEYLSNNDMESDNIVFIKE